MLSEEKIRAKIVEAEMVLEAAREELRKKEKIVNSKYGILERYKKQLRELYKDDLAFVVNNPDAYTELRDLIKKRFGDVYRPISNSGYWISGSQCIIINIDDKKDIDATAAFIREVVSVTKPISEDRWSEMGSVWKFQFYSDDDDGIFYVTTPDGNKWGVSQRRYGSSSWRIKPTKTLEEMLKLVIDQNNEKKERYTYD